MAPSKISLTPDDVSAVSSPATPPIRDDEGLSGPGAGSRDAAVPRGARGQFRSGTGEHEVLDALATLLIALGPDPTILAADTARQELAPGLTQMRNLINRFGVPWAGLRSVAMASPADRGKLLASLRTQEEFFGTDQEILDGLRAAAYALSAAPDPITYDQWVSEQRGAWRRSRVADPPRLACSATVIDRFAGWRRALEDAGIIVPVPGRRAARPSRAEASLEAVVRAVDLCISETGVLPAVTYLEMWARERDIWLPSTAQRPPWSRVIAEVRRRRDTNGLPTPAKKTPPRHAPLILRAEFRERTPDEVARDAAIGNRHDRAAIVASLARYIELYTSSSRPPRTRHYRAMRYRDGALIAYSAFRTHGSFQNLVREAEALIRSRGTRSRDGGGTRP
ncbi:hypothetical protein [Miltoncostaea oceani]|uniref:hypothetical protein n=1 Tax=Miltoncostaea oceani TaxID=2843216 RepID=UPI001C3C67BC|nr:hypothetical protein [Miltoncostaea oceani]